MYYYYLTFFLITKYICERNGATACILLYKKAKISIGNLGWDINLGMGHFSSLV